MCQCLLSSRYKSDHTFSWAGERPHLFSGIPTSSLLERFTQRRNDIFTTGLANFLVGSGNRGYGDKKEHRSKECFRVQCHSKGFEPGLSDSHTCLGEGCRASKVFLVSTDVHSAFRPIGNHSDHSLSQLTTPLLLDFKNEIQICNFGVYLPDERTSEAHKSSLKRGFLFRGPQMLTVPTRITLFIPDNVKVNDHRLFDIYYPQGKDWEGTKALREQTTCPVAPQRDGGAWLFDIQL